MYFWYRWITFKNDSSSLVYSNSKFIKSSVSFKWLFLTLSNSNKIWSLFRSGNFAYPRERFLCSNYFSFIFPILSFLAYCYSSFARLWSNLHFYFIFSRSSSTFGSGLIFLLFDASISNLFIESTFFFLYPKPISSILGVPLSSA